MRKLICIVTALMMLLTMTGTGVFAATEMDAPDQQGEPTVESQQVEQETDVVSEPMEAPEATEAPEVTEGTTGEDMELKVDDETFTVTFDVNGGEPIEPQNVVKGGTIDPTAVNPVKKGSKFLRWEKDGEAFDLSTPVESDLTLTAVWLDKPVLKKQTYKKGISHDYTASFKRIILEWNKVDKASYYVIERSLAGKNKWTKLTKDNNKAISNKFNKTRIRDVVVTKGTVGSQSKTNNDQQMASKYDYRIYAVYDDGNGNVVKSEPATVKNAQCVQMMRVTVTLKIKKNLKCHCCNGKAKVSLKKGAKIDTQGYQFGYYKFFRKVNGKEHWFRVSTIACKEGKRGKYKKNVHYAKNKDFEYTPAEAESFMKAAGKSVKSNTKWCFLAIRYTQHLYMLEKTKNGWKCQGDWDICTGGGIAFKGVNSYGQKTIQGVTVTSDKNLNRFKIHRRIKVLRDIPKWNVFYGKEQALHGIRMHGKNAVKQKKMLGTPVSLGCVRSRNDNVKKIWSKPMKSRVIIY